jgi:uncharacterized protein involved in outer membrane biogenesis
MANRPKTSDKKESAGRRFLKYIVWAVGAFTVFFVLLSAGAWIYITINYPPAKLKALATSKLSETLKRKVTIGGVHFNVLSGFAVTNLHISNRPGWADQDFIFAKDISISYELVPLLWGQISLGQIKLNEPEILVERRGLNQFNFSDMTAAASTAALVPVRHSSFSLISSVEAETVPGISQPSKTELLFTIGSLNISHGKLVYLDETLKPAQRSDLTDLNFEVENISLIGGKSTFNLRTPFNVNKTAYQLALSGSYRYFLSSQSIKELSVKGTVNDLGFSFSGDALNMSADFAPDMDGEASLDMLKFSGLVPANLSSMPKGLTLSGPAKVDFHLSGTMKKGLELKGTADATDLSIQYQDMFVKAPKAACKVDFDAVNSGNAYNVKSFHAVYQDWAVDGSFLYKNGISYSGEIHTRDLPLAGLSNDIPRLKKDKIDGTVAMNLIYSQLLNKPGSLKLAGPIVLKGIEFSLSNEPYIQNLNAQIDVNYPNFKIQNATFGGFDGTGVASLLVNVGKTLAYSYAFDLKNVNAQKAINASVDAYVTLNPEKYKDKLSGTMNFTYKGTGHGTASAEMIASAAGSGNYSIANGTVKGYSAITVMNNFFRDKSDQIVINSIAGNISVKNKVVAYTATANGKIGQVRANGAFNLTTYDYAPDMKVQCDIHKDYLDSDAIKSQMPASVRDKVDINRLADSNGNVPLDFHFTGNATQMPGLNCLDVNRLVNNIINSYTNDVTTQVQQQGQNLLKGLFGQ